MTAPSTAPKSIWGYRIGRILQILGLVIGLEGLLVYGAYPSEGPMIYATTLALAVFYGGWLMVRRFAPASSKRK
jgi:hypothetical protein